MFSQRLTYPADSVNRKNLAPPRKKGPLGTIFGNFWWFWGAGRHPRGSGDPPGRILFNYQPKPPDGDPFHALFHDFGPNIVFLRSSSVCWQNQVLRNESCNRRTQGGPRGPKEPTGAQGAQASPRILIQNQYKRHEKGRCLAVWADN